MDRQGLNKFISHIPQKLVDGNTRIIQLTDILDSMLDIRDTQVATMKDRYDPQLIHDVNTLRLHVDEFAGDYPQRHNRQILECLYINKRDIFSRKGLIEGLKLILKCTCNYDSLSIEFTDAKPLLHFFSLSGAILPSGQDIADELDNPTAPIKWVPTLLDNSWLDYYRTMTFTMVGTDMPCNTEFIKLIIDRYFIDISSMNIAFNITNNVTMLPTP